MPATLMWRKRGKVSMIFRKFFTNNADLYYILNMEMEEDKQKRRLVNDAAESH